MSVTTIFGIVVTAMVLGALVIPQKEDRELVRTLAAILGFWTLIIAVLN